MITFESRLEASFIKERSFELS